MSHITIYTKEKVYTFKTLFGKNYDYVLEHAHREDGPAFISYYDNGDLEYQQWYLNGILHREDGPAYIEYYKNKNIKRKAWYKNNKLYRTNGPASIWYYKNGKQQYEYYYLNDKSYLKFEFNQEILKKKIQLL